MGGNYKASEVNVDLNGDVTLELSRTDGKKVHLLTSSKVLTLASSVFATMFSSQSKEGLSNHGASNKPRISLPNDDVDAFTLICNVIHYRVTEVPEKLSMSCLENVAIICDKYDMTRSLMSWSTIWLRAGIESCAPKDFSKLLLAAYILDTPEMFSKISWEVIILQAGSSVDLSALADHKLVHNNMRGTSLYFIETSFPITYFIAEFLARKAAIHSTIIEAVESPLVEVIKNAQCKSTLQLPAKYLISLQSSGLWPTAVVLRDTSIVTLLERMMSLREPEAAKCSPQWCSYCLRGYNLREKLGDGRETILKTSIGVCLDYVKTSRESLRQNKCRIKHP